MNRSLVVVDHPVAAQSLTCWLQAQLPMEVLALPPGEVRAAPPDALVLLELFLPEQQCGLTMAQTLHRARPDLVPLLWSTDPATLYLWATWRAGLPGFLNRAMAETELLRWLGEARTQGSAWPGALFAQAVAWQAEVAARLRTLKAAHWALWGQAVTGDSNQEIAYTLGWADRTVERRLSELYDMLSVTSRPKAVRLAHEWKLLKMRPTGIEWSEVVHAHFPTSLPAVRRKPS